MPDPENTTTKLELQPLTEAQRKAFRKITDKIGFFEGRNITSYLVEFDTCARREGFTRKEFVILFPHVAAKDYIEERIVNLESYQQQKNWDDFQTDLKEEFRPQDATRVTATTFAIWLYKQNATNAYTFRDTFLDQYKLLGSAEAIILHREHNKSELYLSGCAPALRDKLIYKLAIDGEIPDDWNALDVVIRNWEKIQNKFENSQASMDNQSPTAPGPIVSLRGPLAPTPQATAPTGPTESTSQVDGLAEQLAKLVLQVDALATITHAVQANLIQAPNGNTPGPAATYGPGAPAAGNRRKCIWCDSYDHTKERCPDLATYFERHLVEERVDPTDRNRLKLAFRGGQFIAPNWNRGGMKVVVDNWFRGNGNAGHTVIKGTWDIIKGMRDTIKGMRDIIKGLRVIIKGMLVITKDSEMRIMVRMRDMVK